MKELLKLRVNPETLRRLSTKFNSGVITGVLTESASYIEALELRLNEMQTVLEWYANDAIWITTAIDGVYAIEPLEYIGDGPWIKALNTLSKPI